MRHLKIVFLLITTAMLLASCDFFKGKTGGADDQLTDSTDVVNAIPDSTIYGICGTGTTMHNIELITDAGDTLQFLVDLDEEETVKGGLLAGDRMAVTGYINADGERVATQALNLTTLLGKWTSIDKNFEIAEGGVVESAVKTETNSWTAWKIYNGRLLLNKDTFSIETLGADTMLLENDKGIYFYKRQR